MKKELKYFLLGALATFTGGVLAQTPTIFNLLRINTQSDLRGEVVNGTGDLNLNDNAIVTGTLDQRGNVFSSVGNVTVADALDVTGIGAFTGANLLSGLGTPQTSIAGLNPRFQNAGTSASTSAGSFSRFSNAATGAQLALAMSRGTTIGAFDIVQDGDQLGELRFAGADGTDLNTYTASVDAIVRGTPGVDTMPTALRFRTGTAASSLIRWTVEPGGQLFSGTTVTSSLAVGGLTPMFQTPSGTLANTVISTVNTGNNSNPSNFYFGKSRNANGTTTVNNGDAIGNLSWFAADGVDMASETARIQAVINGAVAADTLPTDLVFSTTPTNSPTERMRIGSSGPVTLSNDAKLNTIATTNARAGLNVPHGTAPGTPTNGDLWTTTSGLFAQINGSTVGPYQGVGGANTQVQYNNSGTLAGDAGFTYNAGTDAITLAGLFSGSAIALNGPTDTPSAGQMSANGTAPTYRMDVSDAAANNQIWQMQATAAGGFVINACPDNLSGCGRAFEATRSGATISAVEINDISILPESGTFTATFDNACTTSPTITFDYQRIGNLVILLPTTNLSASCTGDSTEFATSGAPVPAGLRPATTVFSGILTNFTDNGVGVDACMAVTTSGNISFARSALNCKGAATWVAGGTRNAALVGNTMAYMLGNP